MTEGAEENYFVVFTSLFLVNDGQDAVKLWIFLRQVAGKLKNFFCRSRECKGLIVLQLFKGVGNILVIVYLREPSVDYIMYKWCESHNTACSLPADGAHHKFCRLVIVHSRKNCFFKLQKAVMKFSLGIRKFCPDGMSAPHAEIMNVFSACAVEHSIQAVQRFYVRD